MFLILWFLFRIQNNVYLTEILQWYLPHSFLSIPGYYCCLKTCLIFKAFLGSIFTLVLTLIMSSCDYLNSHVYSNICSNLLLLSYYGLSYPTSRKSLLIFEGQRKVSYPAEIFLVFCTIKWNEIYLPVVRCLRAIVHHYMSVLIKLWTCWRQRNYIPFL